MQSLHDHNDLAGSLVVEPRHQRSAIPFPNLGKRLLRLCPFSFIWVVDDDEVASPAGQGALNRRRVATTTHSRARLQAGIFAQTSHWEQTPVPIRVEYHSKLPMQFRRKLV